MIIVKKIYIRKLDRIRKERVNKNEAVITIFNSDIGKINEVD